MSIAPIRDIDAASAPDARGTRDVPGTYTTFKIDPAASRIEFAIGKRLFFVRRLVVTGRFTDVEGAISLDEQDPATARAEVTIGAASVDTRMGQRDKHLRKADFFDVEQHPRLTFRSGRIETLDRAAGRYRVTGALTVRGVTREVTLDAAYTAAHGDLGRRIKLTLTGPLNRRDFGMVWNNPLVFIPDELTLTLQIEASQV